MIGVINKNIERYVIKILLTILFILVSVPLWRSLENTSYASVAKYYENYIKLDANINYLDNFYDKNNQKIITNLELENDNNKDYLLLLKINKETIKDNINILINDKINELESIRYDYTDLYDYYLIEAIKDNNRRYYSIEILNIDSEEILEFKYNFELIEN